MVVGDAETLRRLEALGVLFDIAKALASKLLPGWRRFKERPAEFPTVATPCDFDGELAAEGAVEARSRQAPSIGRGHGLAIESGVEALEVKARVDDACVSEGDECEVVSRDDWIQAHGL
jgi:hypothetical protein